MAIIDDYVDPIVLTGFVREIPQPANLVLNQVLPDRVIGNIEAALDKVTRTNRAAEFRAFDTETPIGTRDSMQRAKIRLPAIGQKIGVAEQEHLMLERVRTGGDNRNAYVQAIYDDATTLTGNVRRRMELARGDALADGKVTIAENNLILEADFAVPSGNKVTAGVVWSDHANASPLTDIKTWIDAYVDLNGERPGRILTSNTVMNNLLLSGELRELFFPANTQGPNILTEEQVTGVLRARKIPPILEYNTRINWKGANNRVISDDLFILLPENPSDLGYTAWGVTAESLVLARGRNPGLAFEDLPGITGVVLEEGDPVQTWTKVAAVGMPLIERPELLMIADVL
jgi:hypothetical protein